MQVCVCSEELLPLDRSARASTRTLVDWFRERGFPETDCTRQLALSQEQYEDIIGRYDLLLTLIWYGLG